MKIALLQREGFVFCEGNSIVRKIDSEKVEPRLHLTERVEVGAVAAAQVEDLHAATEEGPQKLGCKLFTFEELGARIRNVVVVDCLHGRALGRQR